MTKKALSLVISIALCISVIYIPAYADVMDITDYVPTESGNPLTASAEQLTKWGASVTYAENTYTITNGSTQPEVYTNFDRPLGGLRWVIGKTVTKDEEYVLIFKVKKANDSDVVPNLVFGISDDSGNGYNGMKKSMFTRELTESGWVTVIQTIKMPHDGKSTTAVQIGLGSGCTHTHWNNKAGFEFRAGAAIEIDASSLFFGKLSPYDISFELSSSEIAVGTSVTGSAYVADRLGSLDGYEQNFTYYVTDNSGNTIDGFEITEPEEGKVTVKSANTVLPGNYVVLAVSDKYTGFQKTFPVSVVYGDVAKDDGTEIEVGASGDTTVGVTDKLILTANVVKEGESVEHTKPFTWTVINNDKMTVCEAITLKPSDDTKSAEVSLDLSIAEGNYYVMVSSDGMTSLFEITVDKSGDIANIISKITDKKADELAENMETYLAVLEISDTICASADAHALASVVTETVAEDKAYTPDADTLRKYFTTSAVVSLYNKNENGITLYDEKGMFTFADELGLSDMGEGVTLWTLYEGEDEKKALITDDGRVKMQEDIKEDAPYATVNSFKSKVAEEILLYTLAYPNEYGFGYVADVLTEANLNAAGIEAEDYLALGDKDAANRKVSATLYTAEELEEALKTDADIGGEENSSETTEDKYKPSGTGSIGGFGGSKKEESKEEDADDEITGAPSANLNKFSDIPEGHWAHTDIYYLREIGVINGTTETTFEPDAPVTREQFLKMLVITFKLAGDSDIKEFADVTKGAWYEAYVNTGVASGVINGLPDGTFGVGKSVTRQDACVMLARALGMDITVEAVLDFEDADSVSQYAVNSVGALTDYAVITGFTDGTFKPYEICTRAQAARIVSNAITAYNSMRKGGGK